MFSRISTIAILFLATSVAYAQKEISFRLAAFHNIPYESTSTSGKRFGGISGIEYMGNDTFVTVSDHDNDGFSYMFKIVHTGEIVGREPFYHLQGVESIRYNQSLHRYFYTFEKGKTAGFGCIGPKGPQTLFTEQIPSTNTSANRGMEGITFGSDKSLWVAFESGGGKNCETDQVAFYRVKPRKGKYEVAKKITYKYPLLRCSCTGDKFNGTLGNGISEILALPDDPNKLLVLERCFSGIHGSLKLFLATVPAEGNVLEKRLVFDFNSKSGLVGTKQTFTPDNLEGMTWGEPEDGKRTLYFISDNNFNFIQRNQLVKLVEL